jgi:hypothetical protein
MVDHTGRRQVNRLIAEASAWNRRGRTQAPASGATGVTAGILRGARHARRQLPKLALSCLFLLASIGWAGAAQDDIPAVAAAPAAPSSTQERAEVTLDGVALFQVRGVTAFPAEQRARDIGERIRAIAADPSVPVDALRVVEAGAGSTSSPASAR